MDSAGRVSKRERGGARPRRPGGKRGEWVLGGQAQSWVRTGVCECARTRVRACCNAKRRVADTKTRAGTRPRAPPCPPPGFSPHSSLMGNRNLPDTIGKAAEGASRPPSFSIAACHGEGRGWSRQAVSDRARLPWQGRRSRRQLAQRARRSPPTAAGGTRPGCRTRRRITP